MSEQTLQHHGVLGMHWGVRRYQNPDGTLTEEGKRKNREYFEKRGFNNKNSENYSKMDKELSKYSAIDNRDLEDLRSSFKEWNESRSKLNTKNSKEYKDYIKNEKELEQNFYAKAKKITENLIGNKKVNK